MTSASNAQSVGLAVIGCGDVSFRTYFPGMAPIVADGSARVLVCCDPVRERAERAAALFPGARAVTERREAIATPGVTAALDLTPAPFHTEVNTDLIEAGLDVFTEKPLAGSVAEARELIALAERQGKLLFSAPAVMATNRFRWLKRVVESGRIGEPTLAVAQYANMGPAAWREYTGDPAGHYGPAVGPLLDTGVYALHAVTGLLGPARRVQAMGRIAIPRRRVLIERLQGQEIEVSANDLMLLHLDFGSAFAQVLSSFATPASQAPAFELHASQGSISIGYDTWYDANGPADILIRDESELGIEGWTRVGPPTHSPHTNLIGSGVPHFVAVLRGQEAPILTAAHATHVLEIIVAAGVAAASGETVELETTF
jgi:predicted dehydrogenase